MISRQQIPAEVDKVYQQYAEQFIRKSLGILRPGGEIVFLLRLSFLEGQGRSRGLWKDYRPIEVHICAQRPSFFPEGHPQHGATDATAYGIYRWRKGVNDEPVLKWLDWSQEQSNVQLELLGQKES